jgi:aerobic C4-dicarboxylate transport protein
VPAVFPQLVLGALIGAIWPQTAPWMSTLADLFIRLIAMFVGVIIFCSVVHGIATVREARRVGRVAIKALIYFEVVTTFALIIGLAMINLRSRSSSGQNDRHDGPDSDFFPRQRNAAEDRRM